MTDFERFLREFYELIDTEGYDDDRNYCEGCPCRELCHSDEDFHFGCGVWECYMGEDL